MFQTKAQSCYGCSVKFNREKDGYWLIVRKHCEREFVQQGVKRARLQYAYFHLKTVHPAKVPGVQKGSISHIERVVGSCSGRSENKVKGHGN